ncbi:MAG: hypothetical protein ABFS09_02880 [Thermodesulfobacteriota bacterium]
MKMTPSYKFFVLALLFLPSCTFSPQIDPSEDIFLNLRFAWQTKAVFDNPESVVFDPVAKILFVSNVNGPSMKKDGNGYLSKVALNGVVLDPKWLTGLDAPKGMALQGNTLYVSDITSLAVVDLTSGLMKKYRAKGAKFLNDVTVDRKGRVYVSDLYTDSIYILEDNQIRLWLRDMRLASPNGLYVEDDALYVGSWGVRKCGVETEMRGHLLKVDIDTKIISDVGGGAPLANIDGVEVLGKRGFLITDRIEGSLIHLNRQGEIVQTINMGKGVADLDFLPEDWELVVVPMIKDNVLKAFTLPLP